MRQLTREEIQKGLLDILTDVDAFCRERGLNYTLTYGTLLGAVRHGGFIPWDDDIDILMPRPDFEEFVKTYGKEPGCRYQCLYNAQGDDAWFVQYFAKVHDTHTVSLEKKHPRFKFGLNIDIFPADGKPADAKSQLRHESKCHHLISRLFLTAKPLSIHTPFIPFLESRLHSPSEWFARIESLMKSFPYETSTFVGTVDTRGKNLKEVFRKPMFENRTEINFCGRSFFAPADWDSYLKQEYGDYMQLPPEKDRRTHGLTVFMKD